MSDATRSDGTVPAGASAGAEDIAARLRKAREAYENGQRYAMTKWMGYPFLTALNENGRLEALLEAVQHDIETDMASGYLRETYKRLQENVKP